MKKKLENLWLACLLAEWPAEVQAEWAAGSACLCWPEWPAGQPVAERLSWPAGWSRPKGQAEWLAGQLAQASMRARQS